MEVGDGVAVGINVELGLSVAVGVLVEVGVGVYVFVGEGVREGVMVAVGSSFSAAINSQSSGTNSRGRSKRLLQSERESSRIPNASEVRAR